MSDERNRILYMFTNVVYLQKDEVNTLTPMQMRFYEECQINNFTDMEKQDYVKSLMEYPSVQEMVDCERADAREEGRAEGRAEVFAKLLDHGFDARGIAEATGMTEEEVLSIAQG